MNQAAPPSVRPPVLVCAVGDSHGHLDDMYRIVEALEREVEREVDLVVQVGDFGAWPDPERLDEATRRHGGAGDFPRWMATRRAAPRPTVFIPGNHEDFGWLMERGAGEVLPGLQFLPWAGVVERGGLKIGGLGGCYSPRSYAMKSLSGARRRHYCRSEVRALSRVGRLDLLLLHDAPAGRFSDIRPEWPRSWTTKAEGLTEIIESTRPRLCLHGHLHGRFERVHDGVPITGLTAVPWAGCALLLEVKPDSTERPQVIAEWSRRPSWRNYADVAGPKGPSIDVRPLIDTLDGWADAVLMGRTLDRAMRKRLHARLPSQPGARRILMAALGPSEQSLEELLDHLIDEGWTEGALHRVVEARPSPEGLHALLESVADG